MSKIYSFAEIAAKLGTTAPWRLLDSAVQESETCFTGRKCFTSNEAFFAGHFPVHAIVPGVLQAECLCQLARFFLEGETPLQLKRLEKIKFRRQVLPGDRAVFTVEVLEKTPEMIKVQGTCRTASGVCSQGKLTFTPAEPLPEPNFEEYDDIDRGEGIALDTDGIMKLIPHRYPFLLVDYLAKSENGDITAVKNISGNEQFFSAGFREVPRCLLCEIAAQSGCVSILAQPENAGKLGFFMTIDDAEFFRPVLPGERLVVEVNLPPQKSAFGKSSGFLRVGRETVAKLTLMFAIVDPDGKGR